ncbi:protein of unknown function [Methylocaldum szegediense]|uniref:Uncharacterized protein n=1 Tax=Methylocaldum szegediense TaxID=73780 RepID=A0ABN8X8J4_9GAMM|nr:protein of unknown function [Methylocaldum szegediense]
MIRTETSLKRVSKSPGPAPVRLDHIARTDHPERDALTMLCEERGTKLEKVSPNASARGRPSSGRLGAGAIICQ